jgi:hypothetical protein
MFTRSKHPDLPPVPSVPSVAFLEAACRDRNRLNGAHIDRVMEARRNRDDFRTSREDHDQASVDRADWNAVLVGFGLLLVGAFVGFVLGVASAAGHP